MWAASLRDDATTDAAAPHPRRRAEFTKLVALWIPRRFLHPSGINVSGFVSDLNEKILRRGFVLCDGQVLTTPIPDVPAKGILRPEVVRVLPATVRDPVVGVVQLGGYALHKPIGIGEHSEVICERHGGNAAYDVPARRDWQAPQQDFFGLQNPYQMAEDSADYTWSHLVSRVVDPYVSPDERIAAIVHGERDRYYFYCPCHSANVVYTTRHRLVCMGCGATHIVLRQPLPVRPKRLLTPEEWIEYFDEDGGSGDEEIDMTIVDFQDVETAETIWATNQWDEAKHSFVFFARSSPEEIAKATRGTEADPSILREDGWKPVDTAPPPAYQVAQDSIDVDLLENAAHALREGVEHFVGARKKSERLVSAIPQLFRTVELLLKAKLQELEPLALDDHPNNPTVLKRLAARGVVLGKAEVDTVTRLRRLRNDLQHGAARFNHRQGLTISRGTVVLVDRFAHAELGLWIGDVISPDDWQEILGIEQVADTAKQVVEGRVAEIRAQPDAAVSSCPRCGRTAMVRPHQGTGASCIFCGHVPVQETPEER